MAGGSTVLLAFSHDEAVLIDLAYGQVDKQQSNVNAATLEQAKLIARSEGTQRANAFLRAQQQRKPSRTAFVKELVMLGLLALSGRQSEAAAKSVSNGNKRQLNLVRVPVATRKKKRAR